MHLPGLSVARKKVAIELIQPDSEAGRAMYPVLNDLLARYHEELTQARIALAWHRGWKADADGRVKLGQCKRASDLDRELHCWDFVILLNEEFYASGEVSNAQRCALLDHELSHAMPKTDADGEQERDEKDRPLWRLRKHDIEEFASVVQRHGTWKRELEDFARALKVGQQARGQGELFVN